METQCFCEVTHLVLIIKFFGFYKLLNIFFFHLKFTHTKRPAYRNWNPPLLGTLPDDFLRIVPSASLPSRPSRHGTHLHRSVKINHLIKFISVRFGDGKL